MTSLPMRTAARLAACSLAVLLTDRPTHAADAGSPRGARKPPNIVLILADDLGFSDIGCYGGEIATPNLDRLASGGLRMTQMYNTGRCWPTRACLMTGYYAQQVNRDPARRRPAWAALLPQLLRKAGYRSYHAGKWHVDGKPVQEGFDRSYWFQDYNRYFTPREHYLDDLPLPEVKTGDAFYATTAIARHAVDFLAEHDARHKTAPFFLYLAFIAPHFPLHALPEDIARYRDRYLEGWDAVRRQRFARLREMGLVNCELSPRDPKFTPRYLKEGVLETIGPGEVVHAVAWDSLTFEQQRLQATKMAIHAAMVDRMDREIGRVCEQLRRIDAWENTLIVFLSDNGADATVMVRGDGHDQKADPGSAATFLCLGPGWATASNTPFRRHKVWVHEGGIATPCILSWPAVLAAPSLQSGSNPAGQPVLSTTQPAGVPHTSAANRGALRHAPAHVIDFVPTVLDLVGVAAPPDSNGAPRPPLPGTSLAPLFAGDAPIPREYLYWHHEGNRALRIGDWKLVAERENAQQWELYNLKTDRIESGNLAVEHPERVQEMSAIWSRLDTHFSRQAAPR